MPYPYDNYQISPEQRKGLLIGSMLAGGLGYGAGRAGNDNLSSIVQGLGSGVMGYGGGVMGLQEFQSKVLGDVLKQKQIDLQTEQQGYMKPFYESEAEKNRELGGYYKSMGNAKEMPHPLKEKEQYDWLKTLSPEEQELVRPSLFPSKEKDLTPEKVNLGRIHEYEAATGDKRGSPGFSGRYKAFITSNKEGSSEDWWTKDVGEDVASTQAYTQEDLEYTAKKRGITVDEVLRLLGKK